MSELANKDPEADVRGLWIGDGTFIADPDDHEGINARLIAEVRRLREEIDSWKHDNVAELRARIAELEAQAQELQGAIANATGHPLSDDMRRIHKEKMEIWHTYAEEMRRRAEIPDSEQQRIDDLEGDVESLTNELRDARAEVERLRDMIVIFVRGSEWAADTWKQQEHIAPLFAEARRPGQKEGE